MNEIQHLRRLAAAADLQPPPRVDVALRVLRTIRRPQPARLDAVFAVWGTACIGATTAAVAVGFVAWQTWQHCVDPLRGLFASVEILG